MRRRHACPVGKVCVFSVLGVVSYNVGKVVSLLIFYTSMGFTLSYLQVTPIANPEGSSWRRLGFIRCRTTGIGVFSDIFSIDKVKPS